MQQNPETAEKPLAFLGNRSHDLIDDLVTYANARTHAGITFKRGAVGKFRPVKNLLPIENYVALSVLM